MSVDLLTNDLRKKRSSNQSFWLIGQPDIEINKDHDQNIFEEEFNEVITHIKNMLGA